MRLLLENYGDVRIFQERIFGYKRYIVEEIDPDFGFRYTKIFSGIWYKKEDVIAIVEKQLKKEKKNGWTQRSCDQTS